MDSFSREPHEEQSFMDMERVVVFIVLDMLFFTPFNFTIKNIDCTICLNAITSNTETKNEAVLPSHSRPSYG